MTFDDFKTLQNLTKTLKKANKCLKNVRKYQYLRLFLRGLNPNKT